MTHDILMVAAENDGLPGGKVGGMGDVIREVPPMLARRRCRVCVVTPSYGFLHRLSPADHRASVTFPFYGALHEASILEVRGREPVEGVTHVVVDHPWFGTDDPVTGRRIYVADPPGSPFASDATRFALFGAAVAEAVKRKVFGPLDCIHLHDWHAAFVMILRRFSAAYDALREIRTVCTIHNLALQGVRPFDGHGSSLRAWYPDLTVDRAELADPRWPECINPLAAAIRWADAVHIVSPSYAAEVLEPSDPPRFFGGEGLEADLQAAYSQGRLHGILNGCAYPAWRAAARLDLDQLIQRLQAALLQWAGVQDRLAAAHFIAHARLGFLAQRPARPDTVLTAVSRTVEQKLLLLKSAGTGTASGLDGILDALGPDGVFILLGAGDPAYEDFLTRISSRRGNFIFLNGYSDACADTLYANGDLFVMPSSYEPCGISQMLAMRDGQPCLVHRVGGLKDTVTHGVTGFSFEGETVGHQVDALVETCRRALALKKSDPAAWDRLRRQAAKSRFGWGEAVEAYLSLLYRA